MRILVAYDGREHSNAALAEALGLARKTSGTITVIGVVGPDARASHSGGHVGLAPHAHQDVAVAHAWLKERGFESEMKIAHGKPGDEIVAEAELGYDVVIVGTRGLGAVGKLVLGSVGEHVIRHAPCLVLVAGARAGRGSGEPDTALAAQ